MARSARPLAAALILVWFAASGDSASAVLSDGAPVKLRLGRTLSFSDVKPGQKAVFEIAEDVKIDGMLVMAAGAKATATIMQAEPKTRLGRGGKLGVSLSSVPLANGALASVRSTVSGAAFLLVFGKEDVIPEGALFTVYVDGETQLDPARFLAEVTFTSDPPGARVTMYGLRVGQTPFTTRLAPGAYQAVFSADGYDNLTQTIPVGPGYPRTVHAGLKPKKSGDSAASASADSTSQ